MRPFVRFGNLLKFSRPQNVIKFNASSFFCCWLCESDHGHLFVFFVGTVVCAGMWFVSCVCVDAAC